MTHMMRKVAVLTFAVLLVFSLNGEAIRAICLPGMPMMTTMSHEHVSLSVRTGTVDENKNVSRTPCQDLCSTSYEAVPALAQVLERAPQSHKFTSTTALDINKPVLSLSRSTADPPLQISRSHQILLFTSRIRC